MFFLIYNRISSVPTSRSTVLQAHIFLQQCTSQLSNAKHQGLHSPLSTLHLVDAASKQEEVTLTTRNMRRKEELCPSRDNLWITTCVKRLIDLYTIFHRDNWVSFQSVHLKFTTASLLYSDYDRHILLGDAVLRRHEHYVNHRAAGYFLL